jgi:hypothetical protein
MLGVTSPSHSNLPPQRLSPYLLSNLPTSKHVTAGLASHTPLLYSLRTDITATNQCETTLNPSTIRCLCLLLIHQQPSCTTQLLTIIHQLLHTFYLFVIILIPTFPRLFLFALTSYGTLVFPGPFHLHDATVALHRLPTSERPSIPPLFHICYSVTPVTCVP